MTPRQVALRSFAVIGGALALIYVSDWLLLQVRKLHPTPTMPYESMTRTRLLAIPQKNGKTDFQIDAERPTETLTCVHSLFPHAGFPPCWHVKPHLNDPIPMFIIPSWIVQHADESPGPARSFLR